jgi:predicted RNA-binding protein YlxR (DUF448 family)
MAARRSREPLRTCVGCRRVRAKRELVWIVRAPGGLLVADRGGAGRGAYVCPEPECLERARPRLGGALRTGNVDFTALDDRLMAGEQLVV